MYSYRKCGKVPLQGGGGTLKQRFAALTSRALIPSNFSITTHYIKPFSFCQEAKTKKRRNLVILFFHHVKTWFPKLIDFY